MRLRVAVQGSRMSGNRATLIAEKIRRGGAPCSTDRVVGPVHCEVVIGRDGARGLEISSGVAAVGWELLVLRAPARLLTERIEHKSHAVGRI